MLKKSAYFYTIICSMIPFISHAEVFEEEYTVIEATGVEIRSNDDKIQDPNYQPEQDDDKFYLNTQRRFVLNHDTEMRYFALQEGQNPTLLFLNPSDSNTFKLTKAYQQKSVDLHIEPQLAHQVAQHELFSLMPFGKNLALFFQTQYYYTPEERRHNYALTPLFEPYDRRSSYELIEVTPQGDILHRSKFIAPSPEDGMSFGGDYLGEDEEKKDQSEYTLTYETKTPGDYDSLKPYDIHFAYVYKNGQFHQSQEKVYLTLKEYADLKRTKNIKSFEDEEPDLYGHEEDVTPTNCLDDYFVYQNKAAPLDAQWGNPWLQDSKGYAQFLKDYAKGKNYTWQKFKKNFCPPVSS